MSSQEMGNTFDDNFDDTFENQPISLKTEETSNAFESLPIDKVDAFSQPTTLPLDTETHETTHIAAVAKHISLDSIDLDNEAISKKSMDEPDKQPIDSEVTPLPTTTAEISHLGKPAAEITDTDKRTEFPSDRLFETTESETTRDVATVAEESGSPVELSTEITDSGEETTLSVDTLRETHLDKVEETATATTTATTKPATDRRTEEAGTASVVPELEGSIESDASSVATDGAGAYSSSDTTPGDTIASESASGVESADELVTDTDLTETVSLVTAKTPTEIATSPIVDKLDGPDSLNISNPFPVTTRSAALTVGLSETEADVDPIEVTDFLTQLAEEKSELSPKITATTVDMDGSIETKTTIAQSFAMADSDASDTSEQVLEKESSDRVEKPAASSMAAFLAQLSAEVENAPDCTPTDDQPPIANVSRVDTMRRLFGEGASNRPKQTISSSTFDASSDDASSGDEGKGYKHMFKTRGTTGKLASLNNFSDATAITSTTRNDDPFLNKSLFRSVNHSAFESDEEDIHSVSDHYGESEEAHPQDLLDDFNDFPLNSSSSRLPNHSLVMNKRRQPENFD